VCHIQQNAPGTPQARNQLARALARWDNEGGATLATPEGENDERVALTREEQHVLQCRGAAVIAKWTELPTDLQKALFEHAVSGGASRHSLHLREQIARFLHNHKRDRLGQV
jgi:hypothetical protein